MVGNIFTVPQLHSESKTDLLPGCYPKLYSPTGCPITDIQNTVQFINNKFRTKSVVIQNHSPTDVQSLIYTTRFKFYYNKFQFQTKPVHGGSSAGHAPTTNRTAADDTGDNPGTQGPGVQYLDRDHPDQPGVAKGPWPPYGPTPKACGAPAQRRSQLQRGKTPAEHRVEHLGWLSVQRDGILMQYCQVGRHQTSVSLQL